MTLKVYPADSAVAAVVLGHGAGAGQTSPFMVRTAEGLAERGVTAATFDFAYMAARRSAPDRAPVLEARWREAIAQAKGQFGSLPLFIGGKSMGGRIASHVAAQGHPGLAGLIFLGYPLHPPGQPEKRRDAHLPSIAEPMLFVQGTRDEFGSSEEIRALLPRLQRATLHEVAGADHSFKVRRGQAASREKGTGPSEVVPAEILDVVRTWIETQLA